MIGLKCLLFEETLARVCWACTSKNLLFYWCNRYILHGAILLFEGLLGLNPGFFFFCSKTFLWIIIFSVIFKSMNHQLVDKMN